MSPKHLGSAPNPLPPAGALALRPQVSFLPAPSPETGLKLSSSPPTLKGTGRSLPTISFRVLQEVHNLQRWEDQARHTSFPAPGFSRLEETGGLGGGQQRRAEVTRLVGKQSA